MELMANVKVMNKDGYVLLGITAGVNARDAEARLTASEAQEIGDALFKAGRILEGES